MEKKYCISFSLMCMGVCLRVRVCTKCSVLDVRRRQLVPWNDSYRRLLAHQTVRCGSRRLDLGPQQE